jgi:hypothetical protein
VTTVSFVIIFVSLAVQMGVAASALLATPNTELKAAEVLSSTCPGRCPHLDVVCLPQLPWHVQAGTARGELPWDLQAALLSGRLPLDVLRRYLDLAAVPVLGALCRAFPGGSWGLGC